MLDEMAMQLNQEKSDHKEALSDLKLQHEKEASVHGSAAFNGFYPSQFSRLLCLVSLFSVSTCLYSFFALNYCRSVFICLFVDFSF